MLNSDKDVPTSKMTFALGEAPVEGTQPSSEIIPDSSTQVVNTDNLVLPDICIDSEPFAFAILDPYVEYPRDIYITITKCKNWRSFTGENEQRFLDYVQKEVSQKKLFLICSGGLGAKFVPQIHHLSQVHSIYIHCARVADHCKWSENYKKVQVVTDNDEVILLPMLACQLAQANFDWAKGTNNQDVHQVAREAMTRIALFLEGHSYGTATELTDAMKQFIGS
jgi:hypothetical protein